MDDTLLQQPARIAAVRVDGAKHTRRAFLESLINPHLASASAHGPHTTFEGVLRTTRDIGHYLREADVFSTVTARLEPSREPSAKQGDVDVVFTARERGRFYLKTATEVGNSEGNASATGHIRNVFGGAETLEANVSVGTKTRRSFHGSFSAPLTATLDTRGEISVFALDRDNSSYLSSTEALRGVKAVVRRGTTRTGQHEMGYEAVLRHIGSLTPTASISVREAAGHTVKSSIFHTWTRDTRDNTITGTRGAFAKLRHEFAGLGGDAVYYKAEAEGCATRAILPGVHLSVGARAGVLNSLLGPSLLADRFQLGGPTSVRMFRANSLGPRDGSDFIGGDMYWATGVSLISDFPRKPHWPLKTHLFFNAGQLEAADSTKTFRDNIAAAVSRPSISAGVGLIYTFDPIRLEVNFGVPLTAKKSDGFRRGFQAGMGLEFL
ncbi:hypothetical protein FA95DRAFT_1566606 [Auriscalpium vulgare]|uniref:Uncharacterized protein n=1 Tax=Auriscalpium vulgare TaxID=40419 RepID=A0ACB8R8I4_9AGAM|nr:hypothetical protein FA95DRAFT_1566606 [Auriscalpium vulgare]